MSITVSQKKKTKIRKNKFFKAWTVDNFTEHNPLYLIHIMKNKSNFFRCTKSKRLKAKSNYNRVDGKENNR